MHELPHRNPRRAWRRHFVNRNRQRLGVTDVFPRVGESFVLGRRRRGIDNVDVARRRVSDVVDVRVALVRERAFAAVEERREFVGRIATVPRALPS